MAKTKKNKEVVPVIKEELKEEAISNPIGDALLMQEFLNNNREELFKEIENLITADFQDNPPRIMLTVSKLLKKLPVKEYNGLKIKFEQMVLGGVVIQKDAGHSIPIKTFSSNAGQVIASDPEDVFGKECLGPHQGKAKNKKAFEDWQKRNSRVKVVE